MNILLDECAPKKLKSFLSAHGHSCRTVQEAGWSGIGNGDLLNLAEPVFDVLVSIDKGLQYQQNLAGRKIAIVIIRARSNRLVDLEPHFPACARALASIQPGQALQIGDLAKAN
jgi:predicted nuclease of predicted toxin-antitoxin system